MSGCPRPRNGNHVNLDAPVVLAPGCRITIQEFVAVARGDGGGCFAEVRLGGAWREDCNASHGYIANALARVDENHRSGKSVRREDLIYGVLTGFGSNRDKPLQAAEVGVLQTNIVRSHAVGTGAPLSAEVVRGMMLLRARTFVEGHSGVRPEVVELIVQMLNRRVHPWVPEQGSVGASGDLCPLAHLSLALIGEGFAWVDDAPEHNVIAPRKDQSGWDVRLEHRPRPVPAKVALEKVGLNPLDHLAAKEGLALTNGAALSASISALTVYDADVLLGSANLVASLTMQAMMGFTRAFDPKVQEVRRHRGQKEVAEQIAMFLEGSRLVNIANEVQDSYSLRCVPQVHGAACTAIDHVWDILEEEINAVTDNPLIFVGQEPSFHESPKVCNWDAYSGGNFHGQVVGAVADYLKIAVSTIAGISERRTQMLLDSHTNRGLPGNLASEQPGLNSGFMIMQYTAAALVSENKVLSHPSSVDSIPTSSNAEDYVSMAPIAARHARRVVANATNVLAIELISSLQAIDLRLQSETLKGHVSGDTESLESASTEVGAFEPLSPSALAVRQLVRTGGAAENLPGVPVVRRDTLLWGFMATAANLISSGRVLGLALTRTRQRGQTIDTKPA